MRGKTRTRLKNLSELQAIKIGSKVNCLQNCLQSPFLEAKKWRNPLIYKGFRLVRETGLELGGGAKSREFSLNNGQSGYT